MTEPTPTKPPPRKGTGLRMLARRVVARVEAAVLPLLPPVAAPPAGPPPFVVITVYRARNAELVLAIAEQVRQAGGRSVLWALDKPDPRLEAQTVGVGPAPRCDLLNTLFEAAQARDGEFVIMADDDIVMVDGWVGQLVSVADRARFMLSQPAHIRTSNFSYGFTAARIWLLARATRFVEIGPMVVVHPHFRDRVLPMPAGYGMGWGLEAKWSSALGPDESFGIVDSVRIDHVGALFGDYGLTDERARRDRLVAEAGLRDMKDLCHTLRSWPRWSRAL